ncbi:MAG: metallophosphoesterase family protein, partial [Phycisphaerales bacterium]|nr:metallophosphoesterase family protein [Phycisphaerales bacterium]
MAQHTLILSDLHLGRPSQAALSADALRPLWQDAGRLIINGDLAEIHHPEYRTAAAHEVLRLNELCHEDRVPVTLLSGNHDAHLTDLRYLLVSDRRVLITHGDSLHPAIAPWSPESPHLEAAHRKALARLDDPDAPTLDEWLAVSQYAAHQEWVVTADQVKKASLLRLLFNPMCVFKVMQAWKAYPQLAVDFAERYTPSAQVIVFGHTHRAGVWSIGSRVVLNTGSFGWPGKPHAVMIDGETVSLWPIVQGRSGRTPEYALGSSPVQTVHLSASADDC